MYRRHSYSYVQMADIDIKRLFEQALKQKKRALVLYNKLLEQSPDEFITSFLSSVLSNELRANERLESDYIKVYGPLPELTIDKAPTLFGSFLDGLLLALKYNAQVISFGSEVLNVLGEGSLGYGLANYLLLTNMAQQDLLNTIYAYYLHNYT